MQGPAAVWVHSRVHGLSHIQASWLSRRALLATCLRPLLRPATYNSACCFIFASALIFTLPGQQRGSLKAYISSQQPMLMQHPGQIEVHPLRTKTNAENTGRVRVEPAALPILDLWFWLLALLANAITIRQPISQYMVRASKPAVTQGSPSPVFAGQQLCRSGCMTG